jgi:hypothetical protein
VPSYVAGDVTIKNSEDGLKGMTFIYDDGGRSAAGYKGKARDCVCRAIAITARLPYSQVYDALNELGAQERLGKRKGGKSSARTGVYKPTYRHYLESLGFEWTPTMQIGSGCKVHLRADELPSGRLLVSLSRHLSAVIDGVIHDAHDPSRGGTRCVYGYFRGHKPNDEGEGRREEGMKMGTRIFVGTKTVLRRDGRASWTFNWGDQVKNVTRISEMEVTFEPGDNVATSGVTYVMDWIEFELITRELPKQAKGQSGIAG